MPFTSSLVTGLAGAATLTLAHEVVRQLEPRSPRLDELGMQSLARILRAVGVRPPRRQRLRGLTLLGDLVVNTLYYAPIGAGRPASLLLGALEGVAAGVGAIVLTPRLGLSRRHIGFSKRSKWLTVGLYTLGGLAAVGMGRLLAKPQPA